MSRLQPPPRGFRLERCDRCALPLGLCICALNAPLAGQTRLHLVLPRTETRSTTNTARLLKLWLPEQTSIEVVGDHASAPAQAPPPQTFTQPAQLLFPTPDAGALDGPTQRPTLRTLVVPDGTWSQARRLARRTLLTHQLETCALTRSWPTVYTLRRRSRGLCTFEAVAIALAHNGEAPLARQLLNRFTRWQHRAALLRTGLPPERCAQEPQEPHPALAQLDAQ